MIRFNQFGLQRNDGQYAIGYLLHPPPCVLSCKARLGSGKSMTTEDCGVCCLIHVPRRGQLGHGVLSHNITPWHTMILVYQEHQLQQSQAESQVRGHRIRRGRNQLLTNFNANVIQRTGNFCFFSSKGNKGIV